jgi:hypothetical protein
MADRYQNRPYRTDNNYDRAPQTQPNESESDPLAELARLIGQTDPFSSFGRDGREVPHHIAPPEDIPEEPDFEINPGPPSWMQRVAQRETPPGYDDTAYDEQGYADERLPTAHDQQHYSPPHYDEPYERAQERHQERPQEQHEPSRYDDVLYAADGGGDPRYEQQADAYPHDAYADDYGDEIADQSARPRSGGMMTVVAVLALAFLGTAGAYAYRTFAGAPRSGEAPIIKADPGPNKVVPTTQSADASGKLIQDRVTSGQERIVSREEQPVELNGAKPGTRIVFPPLAPNPNPGSVVAPAAAARPSATGAPTGNFAGDEPRKVKTLSIRPDQSDPAAAASAKPASPTASVANARAAAPAVVAPASPVANAPVSLSPQTSAPPATSPMRTASNTPAATPAATMASPAGAYLVQIASQRSEAEAQTSYRSFQTKYPALLGSRSPLIKRADLGEKGIYFRAMVGPFGTSDEASQFCSNLKTAGGQCVVQRN